MVIIQLKQWPAAGCEAKVKSEFSSRPQAQWMLGHSHFPYNHLYGVLNTQVYLPISCSKSPELVSYQASKSWT